MTTKQTKEEANWQGEPLEEGEALRRAMGAPRRGAGEPVRESAPEPGAPREHHPVIVIGGGQAGLSVGYHLARRGVPFIILDASLRVGDAWRQ